MSNLTYFLSLLISAQVLPPDYTSIIVSRASTNNIQPQNPPPDVILQTLPDVVTSFLESPPASNDGCGNGGSCSPVPPNHPSEITHVPGGFTVVPTMSTPPPTAHTPTEESHFFLTNRMVKSEPTHNDSTPVVVNAHHAHQSAPQELSNLGDLESLNDLLGIGNVAGDKAMPSGGDLMDTFDETNKLDCTWESGSSSSGGSHFEFPCTQDMLGDIGVNELDDIMIRI